MANTLLILQIPGIGIGATALVDLWSILQGYLFAAASISWCIVGRWVGYLPQGQFVHQKIAQTPSLGCECFLGWLTHYVTGIVFAVAFLLLVGSDWLQQPALFPALVFGFATVIFPFFILQPGVGAGIAASRTSNPQQARVRAVLNHGVFGLWLYVSALVLAALR